MKIRRPKPAAPDENVLPMINVVFLLLIFFMLAGAVQTVDVYDIEPPTSKSDESAGPMEAVVLIDRQGRLVFDGEPVDRDALRRAVADQPGLVVRLKADGGVATPRVVALMELLRDAGVGKLVLLTLEPES